MCFGKLVGGLACKVGQQSVGKGIICAIALIVSLPPSTQPNLELRYNAVLTVSVVSCQDAFTSKIFHSNFH